MGKARKHELDDDATLRRFTPAEIVFHWSLVLPYLTLGASGMLMLAAKNFDPSWISRPLVLRIHLAAGVAIVAAPLLVLASSPPAPFARTLLECLRWSWRDLWWLAASALRLVMRRVRLPREGRFNAGQKLNLLHVVTFVPILAGSGIALWIAGESLLLVRLLHASAALGSLALAAGHMYLALVNPPTRRALGAMFHGRVSSSYAASHHPAWYEATTGREVRGAGVVARPSRRISRALILLGLFGLVVALAGADGDGAWRDLTKRAGKAIAGFARRYREEPRRIVMPAPLHAAHATELELASCSSCHDSLGSIDRRLCLRCHEEIAERLETRVGYHGKLTRDCGDCHADHRSTIVDFDRSAFQHDRAGFGIDGGHKTLECESCHANDDGTLSWLGVPHDSCAACHTDPHEAAFESDCESCHDAAGWRRISAEFSHEMGTDFPLVGAHESVACWGCHRGREIDGELVLRGAPRECGGCHDDPHEVARDRCSPCHDEPTTWRARFDHGRDARHALDRLHVRLACTACHEKSSLEFRSLVAPLRNWAPGAGCESCHADVELALAGEVAGASVEPSPHFGELVCGDCHEPDLAEHESSRIAKHCSECHPTDYDGLFIEWQSRVDRALLERGSPDDRGTRRAGRHNWIGVTHALRGR